MKESPQSFVYAYIYDILLFFSSQSWKQYYVPNRLRRSVLNYGTTLVTQEEEAGSEETVSFFSSEKSVKLKQKPDRTELAL